MFVPSPPTHVGIGFLHLVGRQIGRPRGRSRAGRRNLRGARRGAFGVSPDNPLAALSVWSAAHGSTMLAINRTRRREVSIDDMIDRLLSMVVTAEAISLPNRRVRRAPGRSFAAVARVGAGQGYRRRPREAASKADDAGDDPRCRTVFTVYSSLLRASIAVPKARASPKFMPGVA